MCSESLKPYALDYKRRYKDLKEKFRETPDTRDDPCDDASKDSATKKYLLRTPYHRDRDRIVWSAAFRRLQNKTQVFAHDDDDHLRRRLTHSIEVAAIACSIARDLELNEVVTDAIALGHDIGHPPFGHAGEDALNEILKEYKLPSHVAQPIPLLGFDHCAHAIEIVSRIETFNGTSPGLNLTFDVRDGILKHIYHHSNDATNISKKPFSSLEAIVACEKYSDYGKDYGSLEAQCVWFADKLIYLFDDLEDAIRAKIFRFDILMQRRVREKIRANLIKKGVEIGQEKIRKAMEPLQCGIMKAVGESNLRKVLGKKFTDYYRIRGEEILENANRIEKDYPNDDVRQYLFWRNKAMTVMIDDCINATEKRIKDEEIKSVKDVFGHTDRLVDVSNELKEAWRGREEFYKKIVHGLLLPHKRVLKHIYNSKQKIRRLFEIYHTIEGYELIPPNYKKMTKRNYIDIAKFPVDGVDTDFCELCLTRKGMPKRKVIDIITIRNYIAGMTDALANRLLEEYSG